MFHEKSGISSTSFFSPESGEPRTRAFCATDSQIEDAADEFGFGWKEEKVTPASPNSTLLPLPEEKTKKDTKTKREKTRTSPPSLLPYPEQAIVAPVLLSRL